jgi:hypothetical protein
MVLARLVKSVSVIDEIKILLPTNLINVEPVFFLLLSSEVSRQSVSDQ